MLNTNLALSKASDLSFLLLPWNVDTKPAIPANEKKPVATSGADVTKSSASAPKPTPKSQQQCIVCKKVGSVHLLKPASHCPIVTESEGNQSVVQSDHAIIISPNTSSPTGPIFHLIFHSIF